MPKYLQRLLRREMRHFTHNEKGRMKAVSHHPKRLGNAVLLHDEMAL